MQFEDIISGVIAELRNMDHPFIDEWEIEDDCCRKSRVLDELRELRPRVEASAAAAPTAENVLARERAALQVQIMSPPKLRPSEGPQTSQHHRVILQLVHPLNQQRLRNAPPPSTPPPARAATTSQSTDEAPPSIIEEGGTGQRVPAPKSGDDMAASATEDRAIKATLQRAIEEAEQLLRMELARLSGEEDTTAVAEDNKTFAETFVALGAEKPAQRGAATARNNDRSPIETRPANAVCDAYDGGAGQRVPGEPAAVDHAARARAKRLAAAQPRRFISCANHANPGSATPFCDKYLARGAEITKPKITPEPRPPPEIAKAEIDLWGEYGKSRVPTGPACLRGCARYLVAPVLYPRVSGPGMG